MGSEKEQYRLEIGGYQGTAGDSLNDPWYGSNLRPFSTFDRYVLYMYRSYDTEGPGLKRKAKSRNQNSELYFGNYVFDVSDSLNKRSCE